MFEIYYHYGIAKKKPPVLITENNGDITRSATLVVLYAIQRFNKTDEIIKHLIRTPQGAFMLAKIQVLPSEVAILPLEKKVLLSGASETAKTAGGRYLTTMDLIATYFLLTEQKTKLLFNKQIKDSDLLSILRWARVSFSTEEQPISKRVRFTGTGIGEFLVTGWTPETQKYTQDFTSISLGKNAYIVGREAEYEQITHALSKTNNNNVLLVGEIGSGKEDMVMRLSQQSFLRELEGKLNDKRVLELMVGQLLAGASDRSELEMRLQEIVAEVSHSLNVLLYIPDFQNIMGAGSYGLNVIGAILPYLKNGNLPIIATMTTSNFKTYFEENAIREVFTVIKLAEPDASKVTQMLLAKAPDIERTYNITISYNAILSSLKLAGRYMQDDVLPGSAVSLLTDAANELVHMNVSLFGRTQKKMLLAEQVASMVEQKTHIPVNEPKTEEKELLLHLEEKLHKQVIGQDEAVVAVAEALRRMRTAVEKRTKPISFLFLGPTGVGKTQMAKTLSTVYFQGQGRMVRLDMSEYSDSLGERRLLGAPPGEGEERGELTDKVHDNPFSLILLDEFEKASPRILDLFLQVLDDGRLTDNKGKTVSFVNTIIIATSNAGSEFIRETVEKGIPIDTSFQATLYDYLQTQHILKPELLNRFDAVVTFKPLTQQEVKEVVRLMLQEVVETMVEQDITIKFDESIISAVASAGYDREFGARPLRRFIQNSIDDVIAKLKLEDKLARGNAILFSVGDTGNIVTKIS